MENSSEVHEIKSFEVAEKKASCALTSTSADSEVGQEHFSAQNQIRTESAATAVKHPKYAVCKRKVFQILQRVARLDLAVYEYSFITLFLIQLLLLIISINCIYPIMVKREMIDKGILYSSITIPDECIDYIFFAQCIPQV
ncbi:LAQU0S14e02674g1_1 [Lachancea quebecensis]|uniref:LAQU0S14e02674g1_1 n=1 Tax=Lachancea quebecensis TaxID=1654605 RepID=A0A0P1KVD9_9SACH|nr:LAQU0S14e02674g1_1 [Lachancea quebecensis]